MQLDILEAVGIQEENDKGCSSGFLEETGYTRVDNRGYTQLQAIRPLHKP